MDRAFLPARASWGSILRLAFSGLLGCLILTTSVHAKPPLKVGDVPPDSLGTASTGSKVKLSEFHGKVTIISFWASWCAPCRKELPVLAAIQEKGTHDKVEVFAVNWKESADQYRAILKALKSVNLTFVSDERGYYGGEYGVKAIPHMIIIGRDGRVAAIHIGYGEGEIPILVKEINGLWNEDHKTAAEDSH